MEDNEKSLADAISQMAVRLFDGCVRDDEWNGDVYTDPAEFLIKERDDH